MIKPIECESVFIISIFQCVKGCDVCRNKVKVEGLMSLFKQEAENKALNRRGASTTWTNDYGGGDPGLYGGGRKGADAM